jgi:hypothetical protein
LLADKPVADERGRNKELRMKIASVRREIDEHTEKIRQEWTKERPDEGVVAHWQHEIDAHQKRLERLVRRLTRGW